MIDLPKNNDTVRGWLAHPVAEKARGFASDMSAFRLETLLNLCRESTDPAVRFAVAKYQDALALEELLRLPSDEEVKGDDDAADPRE